MRGEDDEHGTAALAAAFWEFSLNFYDDPAVAIACLRLQDGHRLDVNLLLFCCFAAASGWPTLSAAAVGRASASLAPWREEMVAPLRRLRRSLKTAGGVREGLPPSLAASLYDRLKAAELEAERGAQYLICRAFMASSVAPAWPAVAAVAPRDRAAANLACCAAMAEPALDAGGKADLELLAARAGSIDIS